MYSEHSRILLSGPLGLWDAGTIACGAIIGPASQNARRDVRALHVSLRACYALQ